jgi:hypothetical protein
MVSSKLMDSIDRQCNVMKNLSSDSTAVFGGLHVVIVLGDFHQFPHTGQGVVAKTRKPRQETRPAPIIAHVDVVVLTEQMRQQDDLEYHQLLKRARNATLTQTDVDLLNICNDKDSKLCLKGILKSISK